jgi:hypothetical protein
MRKANKILIMTLALVFCFSLTAQAALISTGTINIKADTAGSTEGLGDFTGVLEYFFDNTDATLGQLVVKLTNTTPVGGGFITGFLMNNPDPITSITGFSAPNSTWQQLGLSVNGESGNPFGDFDFGAALDGDFLGGGSPNNGIAVSVTGSFTFDFLGSALNNLTTQSFVQALSTDPPSAFGPEFFLARFKGIETGAGSDKVPAVVTPIPGSLLLLGTGILGLVGFRKKLQ